MSTRHQPDVEPSAQARLRLRGAPASIGLGANVTVGFATAPAGERQRRLAGVVCAAGVLASIALLPVVAQPMPAVPGFIALNQGALLFVYGLTTWLFFAQFRRSRSVALLVLAAGSLYVSLIVLAQLLCFPNLLAPGVLAGRGAATLTWLWTFWHVGPPLFALPFAIMEGDGRLRLTPARSVTVALWGCAAAVTVATLGIAFVAARYGASLPPVTEADGGYWALTTSGIGPILIGFTILSLVALCWTTRLRTVLQLWLAVSLVLLLLDNVVTDAGAARGTIGWFAGRIEAMLAGLVLLGVYLKEIDDLYSRAESSALASERAGSEAQSARENLEIALEASGMGAWEMDLVDGGSRRTPRHDRIFGRAGHRAAWTMETLLDHVLPQDRADAEAAFSRARDEGRLQLECRIRRADDREVRWIALSGRAYFDAARRPISMAGCVLDVTERRLTDDRLRQAERMEAIGQLTGGVAHDFNNLLTVILVSLDMIVHRPDDAARVERLAQNALAAGRRGTDLTEKLLSFSRRQMVHPETINLNRLIAEFGPLLQRAVGAPIRVDLDLDPQLDPALIDPNQLQAAILNLAGNARDAMPSGGQLRIETRNVTVGAAEAGDGPDWVPGRYLRVVVSDTGVGMDPPTTARVFEPFFTTKDIGKGTGLGLSQVYGFVRQAGGFCRVVSAPGKGCSVELYLPRSVDAAAAAPSTVVPLKRASGGEVVLIVEDEDAVREMAAESLDGLGYGVLTAPDARVALDVLRGPARIDILFSDVVMPGGMNGAQLAVEARAIRPELKVLLTSGYTTTATGGTRELPKDVPMLRKPYLREDLAAKLTVVLAR